ncbi:unnamed protein product, partial [Effrenium voratum]
VTDMYGNHAFVFGSARPASSAGTVQFGDHNQPMQVVAASRQEGGLPQEYWGSNSGLAWTDTRGERLRKQESKDASAKLDASERKMNDLSSEVWGSAFVAA